jgi:putative transposase
MRVVVLIEQISKVRVHVPQSGFRTRSLVIVTTLLDPEQYPSAEIASLYRQRWQAELHLRSIKVVLQMDHLRCLTPTHARIEFIMHLIGYNLIRVVMVAAAQQAGKALWEISFKRTLQLFNQFLATLMKNVPGKM